MQTLRRRTSTSCKVPQNSDGDTRSQETDTILTRLSLYGNQPVGILRAYSISSLFSLAHLSTSSNMWAIRVVCRTLQCSRNMLTITSPWSRATLSTNPLSTTLPSYTCSVPDIYMTNLTRTQKDSAPTCKMGTAYFTTTGWLSFIQKAGTTQIPLSRASSVALSLS